MAKHARDDQFIDLASHLYLLQQSGEYFGKRGALRVAKMLARKREKNGEKNQAYTLLSGVYYSAAGNAAAHAHIRSYRYFFGTLLWFYRAFFCLRRAIKLSDRVERELGMRRMNYDDLGVRAAILCKAGRVIEALLCIQAALLQEKEWRSYDSEVLLEIGFAEIKSKQGKPDQARLAYSRASVLVENTKPTTQARYYKSFAVYLQSQGNPSASDMLQKAQMIAEKNGLGDQVLRIRSLYAYSE